MAEFAREFEQAFICFRAAVGEKNFSRTDAFGEFGGEPSLRLGKIKIRNVNQFLRLLDKRLGDGRMRVTETADRDARAEVEIFFAHDIKKIATCSMGKCEIETTVTRHDIFAE